MPDEHWCGGDCWHVDFGYPWCRTCGDHHRPPECAIDEQGRALALCGCTHEELQANLTGWCPHVGGPEPIRTT